MKKSSRSDEKRKDKPQEGMNPERLIAYKWLKLAEAIVLLIVGVVFACFCSNPDFTRAIGYSFAVILLVYGLIEIVSDLLIRRSVFSSEIIMGLVIISVSALLLVFSSKLAENPEQFNQIITWFFGIFVAGYALVLIASAVSNLLPKQGETKKTPIAVLQIVCAAVLIALDITLWIFGLKESKDPDSPNPVLVLTIAVSLILMGFISIWNVAMASKTQSMLKNPSQPAPKAPSETVDATSKTMEKSEVKSAPKLEEPLQIEEFDATKQLKDADDESKK